MMNGRALGTAGLLLLALLGPGCSSYESRGDDAVDRKQWDEAVRQYRLAYADEATPLIKAKLDISLNGAASFHLDIGLEKHSARARLRRARVFRSTSSSRIRQITPDRVSMSSASTTIPASLTISGNELRFEMTTGVPQAIASSTGKPKLSQDDSKTKTSAPR